MKKYLWLIMIVLLIFSLMGCSENIEEKREQEEMKIYGFSELYKAPKARDDQTLDNVIKIVFIDSYELEHKSSIAINVGEKGLFFHPVINSGIEYSELDYKLTESDISELVKILDKYQVMEWSELYGDRKVYGDGWPNFWYLKLQFSDGTVKSAKGYYDGGDEFPENLRPFVKELEEFVASKEEEASIEE